MLDAKNTLDEVYLDMRARVLSLAADLDRIERDNGGESLLRTDPRIAKLRDAASLLFAGADRAERVQMIFSDRSPSPSR